MLAKRLAYSFLLLLISFSLSAQQSERKDSLVRLLGCDMLQQLENDGQCYRQALGNARFEHNSTLLVCDTALWNVSTNVINAFGNVRIIQNNTVLSSDKLDYIVDENLAKFRGTLVQLKDKDGNTLRTRDLDYNTKDSIAVFRDGGALRDKDGQIIESDDGFYYSKLSTFTFSSDVNMYTDSIFVKTTELSYNTGTNVAVFGVGTNAWKDSNMLSAKGGVYERNLEKFTFTPKVHIQTENQEAWADTLIYSRLTNDVQMFGHVELLDTTRNVTAVAGYMQYIDSLSYIMMARDPAVIAVSVQGEKRDTAYIGADTLILRSIPKCDVDSAEISNSAARLKELNVDPVSEYRRKASEAAKASEEAARKQLEGEDPNAAAAADKGKSGLPVQARGRKNQPLLPAPWNDVPDYEPPLWSFGPQIKDTSAIRRKVRADSASISSAAAVLSSPADTSVSPGNMPLLQPGDSLAVSDSLSVADSVAMPPKDSTKISFIYGIHNVKVFRNDMQVACDSLAYTDLDSLVRLYKSPVVWNEIKRQYMADSITVIVKNQAIDRASLMSNAFIIVQEDSMSFDQIRGAEMMAYFDSTGTLRRFDSMGGASGVFFIEEDGVLATVNKFEAKMLTATLSGGNIQDLNYFDAAKSDAYPVVQMKKDDKILKGFDWQPDKRPKSPRDITSLTPRESQRKAYDSVPKARFTHTEFYFPGYMDSVHKMLAQQDSIKRVRRVERKRLEEERKIEAARIADSLKLAAKADSLSAIKDSLALKATADSIAAAKADSLAAANALLSPGGSLSSAADSIAAARADSLARDPRHIRELAKAQKKADREQARKDRAAAKEERWARLDARDAAKAKAKEEKALKKKRAATLKALKARDKRLEKEQKLIDSYKARYEKRKARRSGNAPVTKTDVPTDVQVDIKPNVPADVQVDIKANVPTDVQADIKTEVPADI